MATLFSLHLSNPCFVSWKKTWTCSTTFGLSFLQDVGCNSWCMRTRITGLSSVPEDRKTGENVKPEPNHPPPNPSVTIALTMNLSHGCCSVWCHTWSDGPEEQRDLVILAALGEPITSCLIVIHHFIYQLLVSIKGCTADNHVIFHCRHRGKNSLVCKHICNIFQIKGNNDDISQESDSNLPSAQAAWQKSFLMKIRGNISI